MRKLFLLSLSVIAFVAIAVLVVAKEEPGRSEQPVHLSRRGACNFFTQSDANGQLDGRAKLSQILTEGSTLEVSDVSCVYIDSQHESAEPIIVGLRTPLTAHASAELAQAFGSNVSAGEESFAGNGYRGYFATHDGAVELRIWERGHWIDAHASSFQVAQEIAAQVAARLDN